MALNEEIKAVTPVLLSWLANPAKFWSNKSNKKLRSIRNYIEPLFTEFINLLREVNPENVTTLQDLQNKNFDEIESEQKCEILRNILQEAVEQNQKVKNFILLFNEILLKLSLNIFFQEEEYCCYSRKYSKQIDQLAAIRHSIYEKSLPKPTSSSVSIIGFITGIVSNCISSFNKDIFIKSCKPKQSSRLQDRIKDALKTYCIERCPQSLPFLYVHADMDDFVIINHTATLDVEVSRELNDWYISEASKTGKIEINETRKLLIQVIPKANFDTVGEDRVEIEVSTLENPTHFYFDLKATYLGDGEVWVVARQNQIPLTTLKLKPKIVQRRADIQGLNKTVQKKTLFNPPLLAAPPHKLSIIERFHGQKVSYRYELESPTLDIMAWYESDVIGIDRNEYIKNLYQQIEERWINSQEDVDDFAAELRAFGGQLLDELFPEKLQKVLWEHRDDINSIMVVSTEPFIPWELVHLKPPGQHHLPNEVRFLGQMGLVRWLYDVGWPPTLIKIRPGQVYYVIPHYPLRNYQLLEAEQESDFLEDKFQAVPVEPQPMPVRRLISHPNQFDLLHFACHGAAEHDRPLSTKLLLEGRMEEREYCEAYLSVTTVGQHTNLNTLDNRPMVVLNACQVGRSGYNLTGVSGFAQAFLNGGAGAFVGPLWSVGDTPARIFTETLYSQLLEGQELAQATTTARHAAQETGDATWLAYAVYGHPNLKLCFTPN